ncbi:MAG: MotA/TolQ/ExbB proton channel family protein [Planctomycetaceae bacterium]|jgi:biopolymer transport protein ExbB|nr:MotA/TolQ/ExbB proton channel family protein [Planctomycetaceae bacterium]
MRKLFLNCLPIQQIGLFLFFFLSLSFSSGLISVGPVSLVSPLTAQEEPENDAENDATDKSDDAEGDEVAATEEKDVSQDSYLFWYLKALGPIFAPAFAVTSVCFVMLVIMNWMSINRNNIMPQTMIDVFKQQLDNQNFQEAYETAHTSESPQGKILAAGLAKMQSGYEAAQQSMSDIAEEEIMRLEQKLSWIAMIAGIAPMLGLLGTVFGMVDSFNVIARSGTAPQASELAGGISTALITTQVGLLIAIPAMIVYEYLRNKLALLVLELTVQTENLMNRFKT